MNEGSCWSSPPDRKVAVDRARRPGGDLGTGCPGIPIRDSGADRVRTDDLRLAKPALSQLSYSPGEQERSCGERSPDCVGQGRLELPTSRLSGVRSNHLSYWPERTTSARTAHGQLLGHACLRAGTGSVSVPQN